VAKADGQLLAFDQNEFVIAKEFANAKAVSMAAEGYAYVPKSCATERCRVHVAFHGCRQGIEAVGDAFVRNAGYNRWADTNRLIILYPQAVARYVWWRFNPRGCWDWWGYTGQAYATKQGAQMRVVLDMVERLGAPRK
jgi:poly(3-hydroxybutyrate) depolymerase